MATAVQLGWPSTNGDTLAQTQAAEQNLLLKTLPAPSYARLQAELEPVQLAIHQVLWEPRAPIRSVYFPRTAVVSLVVPLAQAVVEAATVGREGLVGVPVALGASSTNVRALAQVAGDAARMPARVFHRMLDEDDALSEVVMRYVQALVEQTSQSVACNRRHSLEERCVRWLLMTHDRARTDQFTLTHEFLALMLGARRASVTVAAGMLQQAGLIRYSRGRVKILDRAALEAASCECYCTVRESYERLLGPGVS